MKILFTHSYFLRLDPKQLQTHKPYPPLAPLYAAALLREQGHEVALADIQFSNGPEALLSDLDRFQPDLLAIYDDGFNYLTKMCLTNMRDAAISMLRSARSRGICTVVSSSDATDHLEKYLEAGADYVLIGEAELSLSELVSQLVRDPSANAEHIDGLAFLKGGQLIKTKARTVKKELDEFPLPAWDLVDLTPYRNTWLKHQGYFSLNFVTTRGCPYKCNWCAKPIYGNRYNSHSPENIAALIATLYKKEHFEHIWFCDDIFGLKPNWLKGFCIALEKEGIRIPYKIQSRADLLLEDETISLLARSGCAEVWMGAESGSQRILDAMDKGTNTEQIREATGLLQKHGIKACYFLQFGYSGEDMSDIKATLDLVKQMQPDDIGISVSYPLPGTKFYERVKEDLQHKQNWRDSDDLDIMFHSTYSPQFYKLLQRFVHYRYRSQTAGKEIKKGTLRRSSLLGPYYRVRQQLFQQSLLREEPASALLFNS